MEVFSCYLRPLLQVPMAAIPFASETTIAGFYTLFISTMKKCLGVVSNATIPEVLGALNLSHPWDLVDKQYRQNSPRLITLVLSTNTTTESTQVMIEAFDMIF